MLNAAETAALRDAAAAMTRSVGHGRIRTARLETGVLRVVVHLDAFTRQHAAIAEGLVYACLSAVGIRPQIAVH